MTDAEKAGPYTIEKVKRAGDAWQVKGPGIREPIFVDEARAIWVSQIANQAYAAGRSSRDAEVERLRLALDELADHHTGGVCSETEKERGYTPHSEIMARVEKALSPNEARAENDSNSGGTMEPQSLEEYLALSDEEKMAIFRRDQAKKGGEEK